MSNFFGFPKPRKAGFGSPDIPSGDIPVDTANEDVVLEGVIVDYGEAGPTVSDVGQAYGFADRKINLGDIKDGILDPFSDIHSGRDEGEDMNAFLRRMMGVPTSVEFIKDDFSGTFLVSSEDEDSAEVQEPTVESAESVADMLNVMGDENEKLQNFIADAMKNIKKQS